MEDRHIVAIDLGSSKVALTVAKINEDDIQVIYYKEAPSAGIRNSYVFNSMKVTRPVGDLIEDAEKELNIKITQAVVGMPKYRVRQEIGQARMELDPEECITEKNVNNLKTKALDTYPLDDADSEELFGAVAQSFSTGEDFQLVESDIIGMPSSVLEGNFKIFIGKKSALHAVDVAFNKLGIAIARKYFTPDVEAKAVLTQSEMENGVALVDFGGGVTSVSVYYGSIMRHYASIPFGGASITSDIRSECLISDRLAENIKLAFGACMPDKLQNLSEKVIQINSDGNGPNKQLPVKYLSEIITYRVKEIMEAVLYEIEQSGFADNLRNGLVLTGGGANLTNCANYIKEISGYNVRAGYPRHLFSAIGCEGVHETDAAVSIGLVLAAKADQITDCIQGENMVKIGESVTFGNMTGPGEEAPEETSHRDVQATGPDSELFRPEEIPVVEPPAATNHGGKGNRKKNGEADQKDGESKVTWFKKTIRTLFDEIRDEKV